MRPIICVCVAAALSAAACGDSDAGSCEQAGRLLCERACACAKDKCVLAIGTSGGTGAVSFDTLAQCTNMYVDLGCVGGGNKEIDHQACHEALQKAQCVATAPGSNGVQLPGACKAPVPSADGST